MYDDFALDHIIESLYDNLDENDTYTSDLDEDYAHNTYDLVELAYKHYAWYNTHRDHTHHMAHVMSVAHKRHVQVTLDMYVYDDLELPECDEEWAKLLGLEGDEAVSVSVKNEPEYSF